MTYIIIFFRGGEIAHCEMLDSPPKESFFDHSVAVGYDDWVVREGFVNGGDSVDMTGHFPRPGDPGTLIPL
jgi:hypothetical protein